MTGFRMKRIIFCLILLITAASAGYSQSKVMEKLSETYEDATVLVFYYSTLKMIIPDDSPELKDLIYDVEKIKLLMVDSLTQGKQEINEIRSLLEKDGYDEAMSVRYEDNNVIIYIKEKKGVTSGFFFLMEEENGLTAFDLVGKVPMDKLGSLTDHLDLLKNARDLSFDN